MNTKGIFATGIVIISMLSTIIFFQVQDDQAKDDVKPLSPQETLEYSDWSIDLLISLAEGALEEKEFQKAATFYEHTSQFYKDKAKVYEDMADKKWDKDDVQGYDGDLQSAAKQQEKAGDALVKAAEAWIRKGNNDKAAEAYKAASKCYLDSMLNYAIAGDKVLSDAVENLADNASDQAEALGN